MEKQYSQVRAMLAITKASLIGIFRSPSAVVFSIFFPLIFILVFGFIGNGGGPVYRIALTPGSDTSNPVYQGLRERSNIRFTDPVDSAQLESDLVKGRITGELAIRPKGGSGDRAAGYQVTFRATTASADKFYSFMPLLENIIFKIDRQREPGASTIATIVPEIRQVREYRTIDFILPGQLGFSLLSMGVFGVAFLFFNLRQQLVLKRMFATPVSKTAIIMGEGLSRVIFQLMTAVVIIGLGYFAFQFSLVHGWVTFAEIMVLCFVALLVFMGFGFIVSALAPNESVIPLFANVITLPQFLLAGTFFSIDVFPKWLQPFCRALPLTHFNDAMRKIAFEGAHLTDCGKQIGFLLGWGVLIYVVAERVFRWE
ncbi:ABC transporter permease [Flavihumibacter petaseus]|uniref:Putative ABC transporter permease protein n=1 Tax=Flavihumibacter petaseus NBRC 106054 TaxID=1220578 RepID=A0A0E9N1I6_9BACT|nr:ABC transporter permease [Flavihumibacter petaseus]GAO43638.1 putative ABC transporter permease protein [Flavihumibacter petaseus NBRC 106054]